MDNSPKYLFKIGQLEASLKDIAYDDIFLKERDPKKREQYIKNIIDTSTKAAEDYARRINLKETTMKKSELKSLLKIITEEVVAAKQQLSESKGLSGFQKSKESTEHTEKVADSKSLTPTSEPKEKEEGKKLPVVKKPANPQKVGNLKEDILQMIREEIDEMARVKGAVGSKFKVQDPNSPTGWVVKGHKTIPDGTPTEAPKGPYVKQGKNPNLGRPTTSPAASTGTGTKAEIARTEDAVEEFMKYNPNATEQEVVDAIAEKNSEETPLSMDASVIQNAMQKAKTDTGVDADTAEPDISNLAASEKAAKQAKMNRLRAYLMKKKGLKQ
jgi:hypothetical protein